MTKCSSEIPQLRALRGFSCSKCFQSCAYQISAQSRWEENRMWWDSDRTRVRIWLNSWSCATNKRKINQKYLWLWFKPYKQYIWFDDSIASYKLSWDWLCLVTHHPATTMEFDRLSLEAWQKDQPLSILQLDAADRAVLRVAGRTEDTSGHVFSRQNHVLKPVESLTPTTSAWVF